MALADKTHSNGGYFLVHRSVFSHPQIITAKERYAWIWLIGHAAFERTVVSTEHGPVRLKRGQLSYSVRYLADAWGGWSKSAVQRFLKKLEKWDSIEYSSGTARSVITIRNYGKFQPGGTAAGRRAGQQAQNGRDSSGTNKNERKEYKERKDRTDFYPLP